MTIMPAKELSVDSVLPWSEKLPEHIRKPKKSVQDYCWNPDNFSLCFEGFGLVNIDPGHQPAKPPPRKLPDLRLLPGPLIAAADRQPLIDQNEAVQFTEQSFDPVPYSSAEKEDIFKSGDTP